MLLQTLEKGRPSRVRRKHSDHTQFRNRLGWPTPSPVQRVCQRRQQRLTRPRNPHCRGGHRNELAIMKRPGVERGASAGLSGALAFLAEPRPPEAATGDLCGALSITGLSRMRVVLIVLLSMIQLPATAGTAQIAPPPEFAISVDSGLISLRACNEPLWRVLALIEKESGIGLGVEAHVGMERICANEQGETWNQILEALLRGYNKAVVHQVDGTVSRILVLNHGFIGPQVAVKTPMPPAEGVPEAVPPPPDPNPNEAADRSEATRPPADLSGAPPSVAAPVKPSAERRDEVGEPSALLRGLVAPADLAEMESPPEAESAPADKVLASSPGQGGEPAGTSLPAEVSLPAEFPMSLTVPE